MNQVALIGHLTRDVELRYTPNGTPVGNMSLASNRRFRQGDELKEEVLFIDIVAFGKQAENAAKYIKKGSHIAVSGRLQQRRWETEDGQKRSKHEVVAEAIQYLDGKGGGDADHAGEGA